MKFILGAAASLAFVPLIATAQVNKCTVNGAVVYQQQPCQESARPSPPNSKNGEGRLAASPALIQARDAATVPPTEPVEGLSQGEWSRAWWQWAGSFESTDSPVGDPTGALCNRKQAGPVWFLAGTYGTRRTVRTCKVPQGKYLFFPLINYIVMPRLGAPVSCLSVMGTAASMTNDVTALILDVDGIRVPNLVSYRQATTQCFDVGALADTKVRVFPSAANGYYVMLRPLTRGKHSLNFGGALPSMLQAVTYTLEVE
jgi:hypothetical protein